MPLTAFAPNQLIKSSEVNANFEYLDGKIDDVDTKVDTTDSALRTEINASGYLWTPRWVTSWDVEYTTDDTAWKTLDITGLSPAIPAGTLYLTVRAYVNSGSANSIRFKENGVTAVDLKPHCPWAGKGTAQDDWERMKLNEIIVKASTAGKIDYYSPYAGSTPNSGIRKFAIIGYYVAFSL